MVLKQFGLGLHPQTFPLDTAKKVRILVYFNCLKKYTTLVSNGVDWNSFYIFLPFLKCFFIMYIFLIFCILKNIKVHINGLKRFNLKKELLTI